MSIQKILTRRIHRGGILALAGFAALSLAGCASDKPLAFQCRGFEDFRIPVPATPAGDIATAESDSSLVQAVASTFAQSAANTGGGNEQFLVLSGGGQWGAFGSGFLSGWSKHGAGKMQRPQRFNMVTGVSTGALQATFAFLGSDFDAGLEDAYAITSERQLLKRHGAAFFISHGSMADISPLETYVRQKLRPLLDRVAAPENQGRKLLVGVVDGLDGRMYAIDLTRIAAERSGREREDCYVGALLASAAVPVVFRQVTINNRPYLDGGVRQSVFVADVQRATGQALSLGHRAGDVFVLMNGDMGTKPVAALPAKLFPTLNRLRTLVFNQIELTSIFGVAQSYPGMTTHVATAAGHPCDAVADEESEIFSPQTMRCLSKYGASLWSEGKPTWLVYDSPAAKVK